MCSKPVSRLSLLMRHFFLLLPSLLSLPIIPHVIIGLFVLAVFLVHVPSEMLGWYVGGMLLLCMYLG